MSAEAKKSYGSTFALCMFGVLAFYGGSAWLPVLIPAAVLAWRVAKGTGRNRLENPQLTPGAE